MGTSRPAATVMPVGRLQSGFSSGSAHRAGEAGYQGEYFLCLGKAVPIWPALSMEQLFCHWAWTPQAGSLLSLEEAASEGPPECVGLDLLSHQLVHPTDSHYGSPRWSVDSVCRQSLR